MINETFHLIDDRRTEKSRMLWGVARKVAVPFVLMSLVGWIVFGVGFGYRNFEYKDREDDTAAVAEDYENAGKPEFIFHWLFGVTGPMLFTITLVHLFCGQKFTLLAVFFFLPFFLVAGGGILFFNGLQIFQYYQIEEDEGSLGKEVVVYVVDLAIQQQANNMTGCLTDVDIHDDDKFIPIEFAGVIASVFFYWICLLMTPFFASKGESFDRY